MKFHVFIAAAFITACSTLPAPSQSQSEALLGAWASGTETDSCDKEQITYFSSDGVVMDLYSKDGPTHSFGKWRLEDNKIIITHNEFPLLASGQSDDEIPLTLVSVDGSRLVVRNVKGEDRERIYCPNLKLTTGPKL